MGDKLIELTESTPGFSAGWLALLWPDDDDVETFDVGAVVALGLEADEELELLVDSARPLLPLALLDGDGAFEPTGLDAD